MPLDFPTSPALNQIYTSGIYSWQWNGSAWNVYSTTTGTVVRSLNGLSGGVTLAAGSNVTLTPVGNTITIASSGSGTGAMPTSYVESFNGLTGAVSGVTTGTANTFGPLQNFSSGISVSGATFSNNVQIIGNLIVTGKIVTETGIFGVTYNNTIESIDDMSMDGGEF
jgi:hypothetical protein